MHYNMHSDETRKDSLKFTPEVLLGCYSQLLTLIILDISWNILQD